MVKVNVNLDENKYPIYITTEYSKFFKSYVNAGLSGKIVVVTDSNVDIRQSEEFMNELMNIGGEDVYKYVISAGERNKNLETVKDIYKYLNSIKVSRDATLIALGGGVVGDITGFVAATYLRGVNFVQVPTTLLAQVDSSVGGKVGVDFEGNKNIIGAFYQPMFVYINVNSLKTLPERELKCGLTEVVKYAIIQEPELFEYLSQNINRILNADENALQYVVKTCCSIKAGIVEKDEKERDLRAILNFGHTVGHALESVSEFSLCHGEAVSLGMVAAMKMSNHIDMMDEKQLTKVIELLKKIGLPVHLDRVDVELIYERLFFDKKIKNNKLNFILPRKIGEVVRCNIDDEALIKGVIKGLEKI